MSLRTIDLRGERFGATGLGSAVPRAALDIEAACLQVTPILDAIKTDGVRTINELSLKYDGFEAQPLWAAADELDQALEQLVPDLRAAISETIARVRKVSGDAMPVAVTSHLAAGATVTTRYQAVESVGLYVPGGKAV